MHIFSASEMLISGLKYGRFRTFYASWVLHLFDNRILDGVLKQVCRCGMLVWLSGHGLHDLDDRGRRLLRAAGHHVRI